MFKVSGNLSYSVLQSLLLKLVFGRHRWRRSRLIHGNIDYFIVYYKSRQDETFFKRKIDVSSSNSSDLYLVRQSSETS